MSLLPPHRKVLGPLPSGLVLLLLCSCFDGRGPVRADGTGTSGSADGTLTGTSDGSGAAPYCGDGIVDPGEACDDGSSNAPNAACTSVCTRNLCGDGRVLDGVEECDDGNLVDGDFCESDCKLPACENGIPDRYEVCLPASGLRVPVEGGPSRVALANVLGERRNAIVALLAEAGRVQVSRLIDPSSLEERWSAPFVEPRGLVVKDLDLDLTPDVVVTGGTAPGRIVIYSKFGVGIPETFSTFDFGVAPTDVCTGDFNADGRPDLAVADPGDGSVSILASTGTDPPWFVSDTAATQTGPDFVACADVDGDGDMDAVAVAAAPGGASGVFVVTNDGTGKIGVTAHRALSPTLLRPSLYDLEPDGDIDLVVADPSGGRVLILPGGFVDVFGPTTTLTIGAAPTAMAALDFNASAHGDVVVATDAGLLEFYIGGGAIPPEAWESWEVGTGVTDLATGDLNGDDMRDAVVAAPKTDEIILLLSAP